MGAVCKRIEQNFAEPHGAEAINPLALVPPN